MIVVVTLGILSMKIGQSTFSTIYRVSSTNFPGFFSSFTELEPVGESRGLDGGQRLKKQMLMATEMYVRTAPVV